MIVWCWYNDVQDNGIDLSVQKNLHIYSLLIFDKDAKTLNNFKNSVRQLDISHKG